MPNYTYECTKCRQKFDKCKKIVQRFDVTCPKCNSEVKIIPGPVAHYWKNGTPSK